MQPKVHLLEKISEGGFGQVHKAGWKFKGQKDEIAVKMMLYPDDTDHEKTFYKELEILKSLDSPFVVRFIGERKKNLSNET
jgi:serine/threonine protein kinase